MPGIDAVLNLDPTRNEAAYDFQIDENGDILTEDSLEAAILVSMLSDRRAESWEVPQPELRRGWIGDLETPGDRIGSTLWLLEQRRLTLATAQEAEESARQALNWLVEDGIALSLAVRGVVQESSLDLIIDITRPNGTSENILVQFWENTGD